MVGNCKETDYLHYLKRLFEKKFNIQFSFQVDKSKFKLRGYSIELFNLLTEKYGLPKGDKMGKLKIPSQVKNSKSLLITYLRGLFDTDGTVYIRRKKDLVLEISSGDGIFLKEIHKTLCFLGFNAKKYEKHVNLYNSKDIQKFFKMIKPANTKHLKKYNLYLKSSAGGPVVKISAFHNLKN